MPYELPESLPLPLSKREVEIFLLIMIGMTSKEIGRCLGISWRTVRAHRDNMRRKLKVRNVAQLVAVGRASLRPVARDRAVGQRAD